MPSANYQLTSYDIKLPAYNVFNATEKAVCGAQHSTAHKEGQREETVKKENWNGNG